MVLFSMTEAKLLLSELVEHARLTAKRWGATEDDLRDVFVSELKSLDRRSMSAIGNHQVSLRRVTARRCEHCEQPFMGRRDARFCHVNCRVAHGRMKRP